MFLWFGHAWAIKQTIECPPIWDQMAIMGRHRNVMTNQHKTMEWPCAVIQQAIARIAVLPPFIMFFIDYDSVEASLCYPIRQLIQHYDSTTWDLVMFLQYIPRNMHTVFALLCFVVVIHWLIFPYPSGLLHWHCGNLTIAPVPAKQPWWIWINTSCEFIINDCITTSKQSTIKTVCIFLGIYCTYPSSPRYYPIILVSSEENIIV